jgi:transcriptional regulator with XRE-family HTH domain
MNRESLANDLHEIIRESRIHQNIIAQALGLSSAAISQFLHGVALPNSRQLEDILTLLCVPDEVRHSMQERLTALREEYGDEIIADLNNGTPNADGEDEEEIDDSSFEKSMDFIFRDSGEENCEQPETIPDLSIPVIRLQDLKYLDDDTELCDFACMHSDDIILRDFGSIAVAAMIKATGDQLGLKYNGMLQFIVVEDTSSYSNIAATALAIYPGNKFRLIRIGDPNAIQGLDMLFADTGSDAKPERVFPIIELTLLPLFSSNLA